MRCGVLRSGVMLVSRKTPESITLVQCYERATHNGVAYGKRATGASVTFQCGMWLEMTT